MNQRVVVGSLATTVAWVGFATAQAPSTAAPAGSSSSADGPVYVMKTAGQPERRVRVVKSEKLPDGTFLTDVKDLGTGVVYTLTNPAVLGTAATVPATPTAVASAPIAPTTGYVPPAAATPAPLPRGTPRPVFGSFPNQPQSIANKSQAGERLVPADRLPTNALSHLPRDRKADPLLAGAATTPANMTARTPFPAGLNIPTNPPSVLGKVFGDPTKDAPAPRVGVTAPQAAAVETERQVAVPAPVNKVAQSNPIVMPSVAVATIPTIPKVVELPKIATTLAEGLAIPKLEPDAKPGAATGIFDSQPTADAEKLAVAIPPISAAPVAVEVPQIAPVPVVTESPAVPALQFIPTPGYEATPLPTVPLPAVTLPPAPSGIPSGAVPVSARVVQSSHAIPVDVQVMIDQLKAHKRPSFRMENATSLAESQYAKHPDVIAALLHGAMSDTTGVVRGHCISQLAAVGYSDAAFVQALDTWTGDAEPAVRRAAANAKKTLGGK